MTHVLNLSVERQKTQLRVIFIYRSFCLLADEISPNNLWFTHQFFIFYFSIFFLNSWKIRLSISVIGPSNTDIKLRGTWNITLWGLFQHKDCHRGVKGLLVNWVLLLQTSVIVTASNLSIMWYSTFIIISTFSVA